VVIASVAIERFESEISDSRSCSAARTYAARRTARSYVAQRSAQQETRIPKRTTNVLRANANRSARAACAVQPQDAARHRIQPENGDAEPAGLGSACTTSEEHAQRSRACVRACVRA
jgi:hypothetical protein